MASFSLKKHPATRAAHYLFLLPFLPALRPLLTRTDIVALAVYLTGFALVTILIVYGNHRPLLRADDYDLRLDLHYRHLWEIHPYTDIQGYERHSRTRLTLHSADHEPVVLRLSSQDAERLVEQLEAKNLHDIADARNTYP